MSDIVGEFGSQTVGLVVVTPTGEPGRHGLKAEQRTVTLVHGVRFRPFTTTETPEAETTVTTEVWKLTAPPEAGVLAAKSTGVLLYDGTDDPADVRANRFPIYGPIQPKQDLEALDHVTIMAKRQTS